MTEDWNNFKRKKKKPKIYKKYLDRNKVEMKKKNHKKKRKNSSQWRIACHDVTATNDSLEHKTKQYKK